MKKLWMLFGFPRESLSKMVLKMKLLAFLMFAVLAVSAADSYSQETKFSFKLKDATVREVFDHIEENSEFILLYNEKWVDINRRVDIDVKNETVEKVLDQTFKGTRNIYHIYDRQIVILEDEKAEMPANVQRQIAETQIQQPQQKEITGTVTDSDGLPLPGVSIVVKGTTIGTVTNPDGEFSLRIPVDAEILQFSFVGMKTQEIPIEGRTRFTVVMDEETIGIDEVVAVGYGTQKKVNLTGSVQNVTSDEIVRRNASNTSNALQGLIPGVSVVQSSGRPGADGATIRIRGTGSLNSSSNPLVLIDGVEGDMNYIDPNSIESISVLKDAASASIYGSRASNGVILITTKRAQKDDFKISYSGYAGFNTPTEMPEPVSAVDYMEAINVARANSNMDPQYSESLINEYKTEGADNFNRYDTDWRKEVIKDYALTHNNSLTVSGGSEKIQSS